MEVKWKTVKNYVHENVQNIICNLSSHSWLSDIPVAGAIVKVNMSRILLCEATANVIATCFHILGITPVQKM